MAGMMTGLLLLLLAGVTVGRVVDLQKRIIGGANCKDNERLYHVKLKDVWTRKFLCGGSLISDKWILTAAHCVKERMVSAVIPVHPVGVEAPVDINMKDVVIYKDIHGVTHDIALLKLTLPVSVDPVGLPDCSKPPPQIGEEVQIAGHGATQVNPNGTRGNDMPTNLQCANTKVVDCEVFINCPPPNSYSYTHDNVICLRETDVDISPGDSGGGVVFKNKIYGVISFMGDSVTACVAPGGVTSVCHYIAWIKGTTGIV